MVYPIARLTLLPFIRFFIKKTIGFANIPKKGPYIIACKHMGPLDGTFIASTIIPKVNQKVHFIANIAKWGWFWEKVVAEWWAGNIPYYKNNPHACLEVAKAYLNESEIVGIFPEGVIQEFDPKKARAKTGAARLALWAKVPIVPIGLVHDITIRTDMPKIQHRRQVIKNILLNPHSLEVHIGKVFDLREFYDREVTKELLKQATDVIMDKIDSLTRLNGVNNNLH